MSMLAFAINTAERTPIPDVDRGIEQMRPILIEVHGAGAALLQRRWRLFFLSTAGLFGHEGGDIWGVGHYLMAPVR